MNYSKKITVILLTLFFIPLSYAGTKVVIETNQPEDFFVITCSWSSSFLVLHGGAKKVKEKVFTASSGTEIDCGSSWFGDGPSIDVMHPMYVSMDTCAYGPICDRKKSNKITIKPTSIEQYLDELSVKYKDKELHHAVGGFVAAHFSNHYFKKYNSVDYFNVSRFKKKYAAALKKFWKRAALMGQFPEISSDPDRSIASYFRKSKARFRK